ncbi:MAG: CopG family transcriptional regulator [Thiomicrospira sp.]
MNYALRLPDYYKKEIENLKGDVSINQFIVNAVAEKIASLKTEDYLMQRAKSGSRAHALNLLNQVSDSPAEKQDQLG